MGLALGTNLKFYNSVEKGFKRKVRKFWGLLPLFVKITGGKLVGRCFLALLNKVKQLYQRVYITTISYIFPTIRTVGQMVQMYTDHNCFVFWFCFIIIFILWQFQIFLNELLLIKKLKPPLEVRFLWHDFYVFRNSFYKIELRKCNSKENRQKT